MASAQSYFISFSGTGESSSVNTVLVQNLTTGSALLTLNGTDILHLIGPNGISSLENTPSSKLLIYPNPMTDNSILQVIPPVSGDATITAYNMLGKPVAQITYYFENNLQEFRLSGINHGLYLINVKGRNYQFSGKLLSNNQRTGPIKIEKINNNPTAESKKTIKSDNKGELVTIDMDYNTGDRLIFTGMSGNYKTVKTDIPTSSKTITFDFISCTDEDANNYGVVQIGTQTWMAENLKTTKYNEGSTIPLVTDETEWNNLVTPGYCWYNNDEFAFKSTYGAIYNWYVVNTGILCPKNWHVPTDVEWTILTTYMGGESVAGGKLKDAGTWFWNSPNTGATNEAGFTALPGGDRFYTGTFANIHSASYWWSINESGSNAIGRLIRSATIDVEKVYILKKTGWSVRCLKN